MKKISLLIVDDSVIFRTAFKKIFDKLDDIEVVGAASNGKQAVEMTMKLKPDIITMDIEMPVMNGLDATKEIMESMPTKILLVSSLTTDGTADETIKGLSYGALDFVHKVNRFGSQSDISADVINKVRSIADGSVKVLRTSKLKDQYNKSKNHGFHKDVSPSKVYTNREKPQGSSIKLLTIGISTGGPNTLANLIPSLGLDISVPIVIAQHMPPFFTKSLAERLNEKSELTVVEAEDGMKLEKNHVYICPGGKQTRITRMQLQVDEKEVIDELYTPSYNVLLESYKDRPQSILPIIMTGMGADGSRELKKLHDRGSYVIAQSIDSCVINGMPKSAIEAGAVDVSYHIDDFSSALKQIMN